MFRTKKQLFITLFVALAIVVSIGFMVWKIIQLSQGGATPDTPTTPSSSVTIPSVSGKGSVNTDEAAIAQEKAEKKKKEEEAAAKKKAAERTDSAYVSPGANGSGSYSHGIDTSGLSPCYDQLEKEQEQKIASIDAGTQSKYSALLAQLKKDKDAMNKSPLPATDSPAYQPEVARRQSINKAPVPAANGDPQAILVYAQYFGKEAEAQKIYNDGESQKNAVYQDYAGRTC